jgi:hypothetical protein
MWVTAEQFHAGFESELAREVKKWLAAKWPFEKVALPKRVLPNKGNWSGTRASRAVQGDRPT